MIEFDKNLTATVRHIEAGVEVINASTTAKIEKNAMRFDNCAQGMELDVQLSNDAIDDFSNLGTRASRNIFDDKSGLAPITFTTNTGSVRTRFGWVINDVAPGAYVIHIEIVNAESASMNLYVVDENNVAIDAGVAVISLGTPSTSASFTVAEGQHIALALSGTTYTQETAENLFYNNWNTQIEAGTIATPYEPFGEVQLNADVYHYGKNIFDCSKFKFVNQYWTLATGKLTSSSGYSASFPLIPVEHLQGKTITLNEPLSSITTYASGGTVFFSDNTLDGFIAGAGSIEGTHTIPANAKWMGITIPRAFADGTAIQIELGDTETAFEPYQTPAIGKATKSGAVNGLVTHANNTLLTPNTGDVDITIEASYTIESVGDSYASQDYLKSITLERIGESKFFGFGVCQKANIKLLDREYEKSFTTSDKFNISFDGLKISPQLRVSEVHRDETTGELSITVYDALKAANDCVVNDINLTPPYTLADVARVIASKIKVGIVIPALDEFNLSFANGANFDGAETLREVLNAIAEATQTMYYINRNNELVFKRLSAEIKANLYITDEDYFSFDNSTNRRLTAIVSATELGDNYEAHTGQIGTTQHVRNNPFWELREDLPQLVDKAIEVMGNFTIPQFECSWRGNYLLEPGDQISMNSIHNHIDAFYINDTLEYDGGLSAKTYWEYTDEDAEHSNPTNLGEALKQTYAKVDKANKQIDVVVSEIASNDEDISQLQMTTGTIELSVSSLQETTTDAFDGINKELAQLNEKASLSVKKDEIEMIVQSQISNGVASVETSTGFRFDDEGLTISKSQSDITTTITEDGMKIENGNKKLLVANHEGVKAEDLHATTYLIVGKYSRFENYGSQKRTACFWIGG